MLNEIVICCDCDEEIPLEDAHKIKIEGLDKNFYICTDCLHSVPKLSEKIVERVGKKAGMH